MEIEAEDDEQGGWETVKQEAKKAIDSNEEPATVSAMAFTILTVVQYILYVYLYPLMVVYNYKDIAMLLFQKQDANVLDDEPMLGMGMGAALKLVQKKGMEIANLV